MKINFASSGQIQHYITINEIILSKVVGTMCHLSQINKVFILPQPSNQHLNNIYKFGGESNHASPVGEGGINRGGAFNEWEG